MIEALFTLVRFRFNSVVSSDLAKSKQNAYFIDNGMLLRKWCASPKQDSDWDVSYQIVVPVLYRPHVLCLAHDHPLSGHLGVRKTYTRILKHFFWPGMRKDVVYYCRSCHTSNRGKTKSGYSTCSVETNPCARRSI